MSNGCAVRVIMSAVVTPRSTDGMIDLRDSKTAMGLAENAQCRHHSYGLVECVSWSRMKAKFDVYLIATSQILQQSLLPNVRELVQRSRLLKQCM